jgi:D-sedoheptulose 7-phosphate isomerase
VSASRGPRPLPSGTAHLDALSLALGGLRQRIPRIDRWGAHLADVLVGGGRLLAAGNGGSAAQAQHLTAELVGRYRDDRLPLSAIALHAETSTTTAISNDYGADAVFARQVLAHGRAGDVLVLLSTSGRSSNVLRAAEAATQIDVRTWALTGPGPNPVSRAAEESICLDAPSTATVQELHLVALHLLCAAVDVRLRVAPPEGACSPVLTADRRQRSAADRAGIERPKRRRADRAREVSA